MTSRYQMLMEPFGIDVPKNHMIFHINERARHQGNPWNQATFLDESLNKQLKAVLRLCHQCNFETMAYSKIKHVLSSYAKRQRVR